MPVAAIACEPRGIEAQHRANLPGAQGGDQAIEAGPLDGATRRATEIVVDDLDVGEAASTCDFNQLVLAPLAFQVRLDLLRRRLADIDDRLALQNGCRKEASCVVIAGLLHCHAARLEQEPRQRPRARLGAPPESCPEIATSSRTRSSWRGAVEVCSLSLRDKLLSFVRAVTATPSLRLLRDDVAVRRDQPRFAGDQQLMQ